jgi:hypothetical protein
MDGVSSTESAVGPVRAVPWRALGWSGAVVYAWFAGGLRSFTGAAEVAVAVPAVALLGVAALAPPRRKAAPRRVPLHGWLLWLVPILGFSALEIVDNWVFGSVPAHPTWSDLMDPVLAWQPARAAAVLLWLAAGWELLRR